MKVDHAEAARLSQKAAAQDNAYGQYALACAYEAGRGVEEEPVKALYYYKKSAQQGYKYAMFMLARCYEKGIGTDRDLRAALRWYEKAAEQDMVFAGDKVKALERAISMEE